MKNTFTKKILAESFLALLAEKPYNQISVAEITHGCGLSRNVFYYHFTDCLDLINWIFNMDVFGGPPGTAEIKQNGMELFLLMMSRMGLRRSFYRRVLYIGEENCLYMHIQSIFYKLAQSRNRDNDRNLSNVCLYFSHLMTYFICELLHSNQANENVKSVEEEIAAHYKNDPVDFYGPILYCPQAAPEPSPDTTKLAFANAFYELLEENPFEPITVQQIAARSKMSRHTFYYHFLDKQQLLLWLYERDISGLIKDWNEKDDYCNLISIILDYLRKNKSIYLSSLVELSQNSMSTYFVDSTYHVYTRGGDGSRGRYPPHKKLALAMSYASVMSVIQWVKNGMGQYCDTDYLALEKQSQEYIAGLLFG